MAPEKKKKNIPRGEIGRKLPEKIAAFSRRHRLFQPGDRIMVAVSGGPDSVALLRLLAELSGRFELKLLVIHLDHGLRGEDSRRDAKWVGGLAADLELDARIELSPPAGHSFPAGASPEEAARQVRYRFFHRLAAETGIATVALGHQSDDQAETVLMKLLRGGRPGALGGMRPRRREGDLRIIRPLLERSRQEILIYLEEIGQDYRKDPSNRDRRFTRNRVRRRLIPLLEREYNPALKEILLNLSSQLRRRDEFIINRAQKYFPEIVDIRNGECRLDLEKLGRIAPALRSEVIRTALDKMGLSFLDRRGWSGLLDLIDGKTGRRIDLPGGRAVKNYNQLRLIRKIAPAKREKEGYIYALDVPGKVRVKEAGVEIATEIIPLPIPIIRHKKPAWKECWSGEGFCRPVQEYLDFDLVGGPLSVRSRRPGDRFRPLGAAGGRKLKDSMIDEKIPRPLRDVIPLIEDGEGIILPAGFRPADRCRLTERSRRALKITVRRFSRD